MQLTRSQSGSKMMNRITNEDNEYLDRDVSADPPTQMHFPPVNNMTTPSQYQAEENRAMDNLTRKLHSQPSEKNARINVGLRKVLK